MSHLIFYILIGLTFANLCLLILMLNAVHSLLLLIQIFLFGSWFLFLLNMEFFGLIFLMIYLGAILVLFLFVVMMLDIKVAVVEHDDLGGFFYKSFFIWFLIPVFFWAVMGDYSLFDIFSNFYSSQKNLSDFIWTPFFVKANFFEIVSTSTTLEVLGRYLFQQHLFVFLIAGILLYVAMVGAIVATMEKSRLEHQKLQNASVQTMRKNVIRFFRSRS